MRDLSYGELHAFWSIWLSLEAAERASAQAARKIHIDSALRAVPKGRRWASLRTRIASLTRRLTVARVSALITELQPAADYVLATKSLPGLTSEVYRLTERLSLKRNEVKTLEREHAAAVADYERNKLNAKTLARPAASALARRNGKHR